VCSRYLRIEDAVSELKGTLPTVERGHNVVLVLPPSPAAARPVIETLVGRLGNGVRGLMLVPPAAVGEWGRLAYAAAEGRGLRVEAALTSSRALRELRSSSLDLLVAPPATVLELIERSALKPDQLGVLLLAQPETWSEHPVLTPLMQDLAEDAQRIIITSDPGAAEDLIERYARKALLGGMHAASASGPVRAVATRWAGRGQALADLFQLLDPVTASIWIADDADRPSVEAAVQVDGTNVQVVTGDIPAADLIVAWDLPSPVRLAQMVEAGDTVLLMPPGTEGYVQRLASSARGLRLPGFMEQLAASTADERLQIRAELESGDPSASLLSLAPLFERHEPARVAAALYALWRKAQLRGRHDVRTSGLHEGREDARAQDLHEGSPDHLEAMTTGRPPLGQPGPTAKIWVSVGKREGVTPADLVGALTRELKVDRAGIGRIELRDGFSLIELPAHEAERIAQALSGKTIRRIRVSARLDRGQSAGERGPSGNRDRQGSRERPVRRGGGRPRP
jgi:ATP-dependent RNA helicase DeaD